MWNEYMYHIERDHNVHTYTHYIAVIFEQLIITTGFSTTVKIIPILQEDSWGSLRIFCPGSHWNSVAQLDCKWILLVYSEDIL